MKTTQEMIAVMQASTAGEKIQYRSLFLSDKKWYDCPAPGIWNWHSFDYRVAPREVVVHVYENPRLKMEYRFEIRTKEMEALSSSWKYLGQRTLVL